MSRADAPRLADIRAAIETIQDHVSSGTFDRKTSDAVLNNLVVIGEAASRLSDEARSQAPEIPWSKVVGLRNLLAHEYFRIDLEVISSIIEGPLEALRVAVDRLLDGRANAH